MEASTAAVAADALTVIRGGKRIFDGLSLDIPAQQITGLLGPSGCGKTTLMRAIVGVQAKVTGTLTVLGRPAGDLALTRRVSYATQSASVYDDLTVLQNLRYFCRVKGLPLRDVDRVIELVDLGDHRDARVDNLSGGQRGRVSLGVALLGGPELIVLDEPTVGLDPVLRAELWGLFRRLSDEGASLIVSSHVMDEAMNCDRLLLMREGIIVADTTPQELLSSTGASNPESAFLTVIARRGNGPPEAAR